MKNLTMISIGIFILGVVFISGCIEEIENKPPEESIYYYTETGGFNQTHASIVWNKISGSDEAKFVTSERYYSAVIFMHPYTVGVFDPSTAEWVTVISSIPEKNEEVKIAIFRLDYQTFDLKESYKFSYPSNKELTLEESIAIIEEEMKKDPYGNPYGNRPVEKEKLRFHGGNYIYSYPATDFGGTVIVNKYVGRATFYATTVWDGKGKLIIPEDGESNGTPLREPYSWQLMTERVFLWENGESKFVAGENSSLSNFLLKTLHRVDIQAKCVFEEERVQRMKKNNRILEMSFRFPENITISQQIGPNHGFIPTNESGYRILENVSDALFILEDNLNEELDGHILVSYEEVKAEGTTNYACWAVSEEGSKDIDKTWIDEINSNLVAIAPVNSSITMTGMLTVIADEDCGIPEGCGPKYKLWDSRIRNFIPLLGNFKKEESELIVQVTGTKAILLPSEYGDMNYMGPTDAIQVISYSTLSKIQYHKFMVNKAGEYTSEKYPCLSFREEYSGGIFTRWNKAFSWEVHANSPILKVRMTDTSADKALQPFYELWYNGNSGSFIKESKYPSDAVFCP